MSTANTTAAPRRVTAATFADAVLTTDGDARPAAPQDGKAYGLREVYALLGCDRVEVVYTRVPGVILVCDEDGGMVAEPAVNRAASVLAGTTIVGNVLACHTSRFR
jgi:hypothetical protein